MEFKIDKKARELAEKDVRDFIEHVKEHELYEGLKDRLFIEIEEVEDKKQLRSLSDVFRYPWGIAFLLNLVVDKYKRLVETQVLLAAEKILEEDGND